MNVFICNGNLGKEPEVKTTASGKKVCSFSLAVDDGKDANGNKKSQWLNFVAWDNKAEYLEKYCHKGYRLLVQGKLSTRKYTLQTGEQRTATDIVVDRLEIERGGENGQGQRNTRPNTNRSQTARNEASDSWLDEPIDDDRLPF